MKRKMLFIILVGIVVTLAGVIAAAAQAPRPVRLLRAASIAAGTGFTYLGQLRSGGSPVSATCDFIFGLYDDPVAGTQVGSSLTATFAVTNGLFTRLLDFGSGAINGDARWLDLQVRCPAGVGGYTALTPRQALTAAPLALALPGMWTQPNATSPNVIGGYSGNSTDLSVFGAAIGGGGAAAFENRIASGGNFATIGGGYANSGSGQFATIGGGVNNTVSGFAAAAGGGYSNSASLDYATVAGGVNNSASGSSTTVGGGSANIAAGYNATIGGGYHNAAGGYTSTVSGGELNTALGRWATIGGGYGNTASLDYATVGGGYSNTASYLNSTVGGGYSNTASSNNSIVGGGNANWARFPYTTIGGGDHNLANKDWATIAGGSSNKANGTMATVGGGSNNLASGVLSTIPGGQNNYAADYSMAAGQFANATDPHTFVWSDGSSGLPFNSGGDYHFDVLATGGISLVTALDGKGNPLYGVYIRNPNGSMEVTGRLFADGGFNGQCLNSGNFNTTAGGSCNMDVAESFASAEQTEPGDLVALVAASSGPTVRKAAGTLGGPLLGVVSRNPGLVFDNGQTHLAGDNSRLITSDRTVVALVGRVLVKVSLEGGPIAVGDPLTCASTSGYAMKATQGGQIIGYALQRSGELSDGKLLAWLQPGLYLPPAQLAHLNAAAAADTTVVAAQVAQLQTRNAALEQQNTLLAARISALEHAVGPASGSGHMLDGGTPATWLLFCGLIVLGVVTWQKRRRTAINSGTQSEIIVDNSPHL